MNITKTYSTIICLSLVFLTSGFRDELNENSTSINTEELLQRHNFYREQVGVPDLKWSVELQEYAQKWADRLSRSCDLIHSKGKYGENIYWTSGSSTAKEVVDNWAEEERYFNHKNTTYKSGKGSKSGHYSQIIWKETTHVGGAMANCRHGGEMWVCSYSPHGNVIGKKAY